MMMNATPHLTQRLSKLCVAFVIALTSAACGMTSSGDPDVGAPVADFSESATRGGPGLVVEFSDESTGEVDAYEWDFGAAGTSDERNPMVRFDEVGVYTVTLAVSGPEGGSNIEKPMLIEVFEADDAGVADFVASATSGGPGLTVTFDNTSLGDLTSHTWDFGDVAIPQSAEHSPTVTFTEVGTYTITLTVEGSAGAGQEVKADHIEVMAPADAEFVDFEADRTSGGPGLTVQFTDVTAGTPTSWDWDFGNGVTSSDEVPAAVVYTDPGDYTVTLEVDGDRGNGIETKVAYITVSDAGGSGLADFTVDMTEGLVGQDFQFEDLSSGDPTTWSWRLATPTGGELISDLEDPLFNLTEVGTYDVTLTINGPNGESTLTRDDYIRVFDAPVAAFSCTPEGIAFSPITRTCTNESTDAKAIVWKFGERRTCYHLLDESFAFDPEGNEACGTADPSQVFTNEPNAETTFDDLIELTAYGPGGEDTATLTVSTSHFYISPTVPSGSAAPVDVRFRARDGVGIDAEFHVWQVMPQFEGFIGTPWDITLRQSGTYEILVAAVPPAGFGDDGLEATLQYVVAYGPPTAGFDVETTSGYGPFDAQFNDLSTGDVTTWFWDFGDGSGCYHSEDPDYELQPGDPTTPCGSSEPSHTFQNSGWYDVTLEVEGPDAEGSSTPTRDEFTFTNAVGVWISDPSFELQSHEAAISGSHWTTMRPATATETRDHIGLGTDGSITDNGMPSDGDKWAMIDGRGTEGLVAVEEEDNYLRQTVFMRFGRPVLEFDYAFLYIESPGGSTFDGMVATVSDGVDEIVIPSSVADTTTAYAGLSAHFPELEGRDVRSTPLMTASINLEDAFPGSDEFTPFEVTIRVANAVNEDRGPLGYVDNFRFSRAATDTMVADFVLDTDPVIAGQPASFRDLSCSDPGDACEVPSSWRWDFDTHTLPVPPAASGSGEQDPSYTFDAPGDYTVMLTSRRTDVEDTATLVVTVLEAPEASFEIVTPGPYSAPAGIEFLDTSTSDAGDPIVAWDWDFEDWGTSDLQDPGVVDFGQVGTYTVTLTVTTAAGATSSAERIVDVVP